MDYLPDGAIEFKKANNQVLQYTASINDQIYSEYHRTNGITAFKFVNAQGSHYYTRVPEGMISLVDLINRSYIHYVTENLKLKTPGLWMISAVQYMPIVGQVAGYILRIISVCGACLYPLALSLLFPIFMYLIVLDKEQKMLEMMKMNGMKMLHYWGITYIFCMIITFMTYIVFVLFGIFALKLDFFDQTNLGLMVTSSLRGTGTWQCPVLLSTSASVLARRDKPLCANDFSHPTLGPGAGAPLRAWPWAHREARTLVQTHISSYVTGSSSYCSDGAWPRYPSPSSSQCSSQRPDQQPSLATCSLSCRR